jgi:hypothetical protein
MNSLAGLVSGSNKNSAKVMTLTGDRTILSPPRFQFNSIVPNEDNERDEDEV